MTTEASPTTAGRTGADNPTIDKKIARLFGLRGDKWMRHANALSVWTRFSASSFVDGDVVDLCNLAVLEGDRRRGVGTALIDRRLGDAAARGATRAVSAVSPEGWQVYQRRGFRSVPARRDVCFYLPSDVA